MLQEVIQLEVMSQADTLQAAELDKPSLTPLDQLHTTPMELLATLQAAESDKPSLTPPDQLHTTPMELLVTLQEAELESKWSATYNQHSINIRLQLTPQEVTMLVREEDQDTIEEYD